MITLGFCNLKGGVGKTTACQNIAVALAKTGRKVAVVDMDPQSNLSAGFGVTPGPSDPQVFDLLTDEATWDDIVRQKEGVDIVPSSLNLVMAELNNSGLFENDFLLRNAIKQIPADRYDYVIIDSPPQLGIFTRNVLAACDKIIVPMDGGFYSLFGLKLLQNSLPVLRERLENNLEILGILMTNYNSRFYIASSIFDEVKKSFSGLLFESYVSQSVSLIEASSMGLSIFEYSPKSKAAQCYKEVAEELIKRLEGRADKIELLPAGLPSNKNKKPGRPKKAKEPKKLQEETTPEPEVEPETEIKNEVQEISVPVSEPEHEPEAEPEITTEISNFSETPVENSPNIEVPQEQAQESEQPPAGECRLQGLPPEQEMPEAKIDNIDNIIEEPAPVYEHRHEAGAYEQGIKQDLIDMLPERQKAIWAQILAPINDVSRGEIDIKELREDFNNSDKYRYTFYVLNDEDDKLNAVSFPDQIVEPLRCVVKLDENGSAEIFF